MRSPALLHLTAGSCTNIPPPPTPDKHHPPPSSKFPLKKKGSLESPGSRSPRPVEKRAGRTQGVEPASPVCTFHCLGTGTHCLGQEPTTLHMAPHGSCAPLKVHPHRVRAHHWRIRFTASSWAGQQTHIQQFLGDRHWARHSIQDWAPPTRSR